MGDTFSKSEELQRARTNAAQASANTVMGWFEESGSNLYVCKQISMVNPDNLIPTTAKPADFCGTGTLFNI